VLSRHCRRHHQASVQKAKKNNNIHYILLESAEALNFEYELRIQYYVRYIELEYLCVVS